MYLEDGALAPLPLGAFAALPFFLDAFLEVGGKVGATGPGVTGAEVTTGAGVDGLGVATGALVGRVAEEGAVAEVGDLRLLEFFLDFFILRL
jgi:hypothetical protein